MIRERIAAGALPTGAREGEAAGPAFPSYLALGQALYYVGTGLWPLVDIASFQRVTGPKRDLWLVKTVAVLVTVIGGVVGFAGLRRRIPPEVPLLGAGSALGLAGIDLVYTLRRRISPIYLVDAIAELSLVAGWVAAWRVMRGRRGG